MLRGLRNASSSIIGKSIMGIVVGVLVVAFAIWGIGDIFKGYGRSTVAKVGSLELSTEQCRQMYNDRLRQLGNQLGRPLTPAQARALGVEQQILGQIVAAMAIGGQARRMPPPLCTVELP